MKTLKNKMKNKKGFTLMEMLIVVAIMVVLVAVSIPVFTNQLNKAKTTTDDANLRAARSVAMTSAMLLSAKETVEDFADGHYYNVETGKFQDAKPTPGYGQAGDNAGEVIVLTYDEDTFEASVAWTDEVD